MLHTNSLPESAIGETIFHEDALLRVQIKCVPFVGGESVAGHQLPVTGYWQLVTCIGIG
jgi:hypothetical protein